MADDVLAKALAALGRKARTEAEMREWLLAREVEGEEVERVIGFLIENLAIDDRAYAVAFTSDKRELAGWGRDRIREVLIRRGVDRYLVEEALAASGIESEVERAVRVLIEKGAELDDDRGRQRALGLLARRGYEAEEAYAAIRIAGRAA
ncbi:MAG: RecX family transcriptional regulator [Solirubrobacterales bacterium]|nr:RecX family transcriptional regulator [Solirubrobacterales bacterium]